MLSRKLHSVMLKLPFSKSEREKLEKGRLKSCRNSLSYKIFCYSSWTSGRSRPRRRRLQAVEWSQPEYRTDTTIHGPLAFPSAVGHGIPLWFVCRTAFYIRKCKVAATAAAKRWEKSKKERGGVSELVDAWQSLSWKSSFMISVRSIWISLSLSATNERACVCQNTA